MCVDVWWSDLPAVDADGASGRELSLYATYIYRNRVSGDLWRFVLASGFLLMSERGLSSMFNAKVCGGAYHTQQSPFITCVHNDGSKYHTGS